MSYLDLFLRASTHLQSLDVEVLFTRQDPVSGADVRRAQALTDFKIPQSLVQLLEDVGNGILFKWNSGKRNGPFANFHVQPLEDLVQWHESRKEYTVEWDANYEYRHVKNPSLANDTATAMRGWFGFFEEGNGDRLCIDTTKGADRIVLDEHDWMDGGSGRNGSPAGANLEEFLQGWSQVCFQFPKSLFWPWSIQNGCVNWEGAEFRSPFRL